LSYLYECLGDNFMRSASLLFSILLLAHAVQARPLVIVAEVYAPATFIEDGHQAGIDIDVAKAVFDRLGIAYEIKLLPWARAWEMLKAGDADVGLHVSYTEDRARYVRWPKNPVWQADFVFFTNQATRTSYDFKNYEDVKRAKVRIGIINENAYYPNFWEAFPSPDRARQNYYAQLEAANDAATNLRKLERNHIQLFPIAKILGMYMVRDMHLENITYYDWVLFSKPYPNAFSDKSNYSDARYQNIQAVMQAYDTELGSMKSNSQEYQKFFERYQVPYLDTGGKVAR
jgi:ABC-type amino acid transport substrate-binding protein